MSARSESLSRREFGVFCALIAFLAVVITCALLIGPRMSAQDCRYACGFNRMRSFTAEEPDGDPARCECNGEGSGR